MSEVLSFPPPTTAARRGWSQQELAEFYRVEAALVRAGLPIDSEQGLSDEAEPWFVFCRPDGAPIMHFARIGGRYLVASEVLDGPLWGDDFRGLINQVALRHPELLPIRQGGDGTRITVHPAALLAALVAAATVILSSEDAEAAELGNAAALAPVGRLEQAPQPRPGGSAGPAEADERDSYRKQLEALVVSAMIFAAFAAEEAESRGGLEALVDPQARAAKAQDIPLDADSSASPDGAVHRAGPGAPHVQGSAGAVPAGSGSAVQPGAAAGSRPVGAEVAPDGPEKAAPAQGGPLTAEPNGHAVFRSGEAGPSRAAGSPASVEPGLERSAASSSAASLGDAAGVPRTGADDAAVQSQPRSVAHAAEDAVSGGPVRIERALHRNADKGAIEADEAGRGAAKGADGARGIEGSKGIRGERGTDGDATSADGHSGRVHAERPGEASGGADPGRRESDGDLGRAGDRSDAPGGPAESRGHHSVASAEVPAAQPDAVSRDGRGDSRPASGGDTSDLGEHGSREAGAPVETASTSHSWTQAGTQESDAHPAKGAESSGKAAGGAEPAAGRGSDAPGSGEHGAAKAAAAVPAHAEGGPSAATHSPASESGHDGNVPRQLGGGDKLVPAGHGEARSGASGEAASTSHPHDGPAQAGEASSAEAQGRGAHGHGQTTGLGTDSAIPESRDAASLGAAGKAAAASHLDDPPLVVNRKSVAATPDPDAGHGRTADGAGPGPQRDAATHAPAAPHATTPQADDASVQPRNAGAAISQGPGKVLAANVDAHGNIVFSSDPGHDSAPAPGHVQAHDGAHAEVGLVGLADHPGQMHHLDLHG
ncbi:hypothetical protein GCM10007886_10860 [Methylobacterium gregans]|uniref:Uncharacterized protein n=1 Tax=Methylobacterium gregans TaxID=374424 RepID=A0AA37HMZ6_9HYPH|nr:hypothetical protein [Methylobacterium gregans]MDQ0519456.1 hypothetical protein [Methylobacterium gregans]GJD78550.1 hypothetical protein NBEOAGPD_1767 [Methylobacterium gregans]GLS52903.1 hypothetical protein GCM10007886_10860 [Methylobacterium gregans]